MKKKSYDNPYDVLDDEILTVENDINGIIIRQQEIQNFISSVETSISDIEQNLLREKRSKTPNYESMKALRGALSKNIELVKDLYDSYRGFEDSKVKYRKLISDAKLNYQQLVKVKIRQLDIKSEKVDDTTLISLLRNITKNKTAAIENFKDELDNDSDYRM